MDEQNAQALAQELDGGKLKSLLKKKELQWHLKKIGEEDEGFLDNLMQLAKVTSPIRSFWDVFKGIGSLLDYVEKTRVDLYRFNTVTSEPGFVLTGVSTPVADKATLIVRRSSPSGLDYPEDVYFHIAGSGITSDDYDIDGYPVDGDICVEIPAGEACTIFNIVARPDSKVEGEEKMTLTMSPQTGSLGGGTATVTIEDPTVGVTFVEGDMAEPGGQGLIRFNRNGGTYAPLLVQYTLDGDATNGVDYLGSDGKPLSGSIIIPAGKTTVDMRVLVLADALKVGDESLIAKVTQTAVYAVDPVRYKATGTIADCQVSINVAPNVISEAGGRARFTVTRTGDLTLPLDIGISHAGTATIGRDYSGMVDQIHFAAGQSSTTFDIVAVYNFWVGNGSRLGVSVSLHDGSTYVVQQRTVATDIVDNDVADTFGSETIKSSTVRVAVNASLAGPPFSLRIRLNGSIVYDSSLSTTATGFNLSLASGHNEILFEGTSKNSFYFFSKGPFVNQTWFGWRLYVPNASGGFTEIDCDDAAKLGYGKLGVIFVDH